MKTKSTDMIEIHSFSLAVEKVKGMMSTGGVTLLMVDSDKEFCDLWEAILATYGKKFAEAHSPEQAKELVEFFGSKNIGKIIIDFNLKNETGLAFREWCRKVCPGVPIMMISTNHEIVDQYNQERPSIPFVCKDDCQAIYSFLGLK